MNTKNNQSTAPVERLVHTPGPWRVRARFDVVQDLGIYGGYFVGSTRGNSDDLPASIQAQDEANAKLIAAAPEMFAALKAIAALDYTGGAINAAAWSAVGIAQQALKKVV